MAYLAGRRVRAARAVPSRPGRRLDLPGLATSAAALLALTYALIEGNVRGWTSAPILGAFAVAARRPQPSWPSRRTEHPMVALRMFRRREFSGGTGTMMIWAFGIFGIYFFTSIYLQLILGFSPTKAGLVFVPMAVCIALAAAIAPLTERWVGAHRTVAFALPPVTVGQSQGEPCSSRTGSFRR